MDTFKVIKKISPKTSAIMMSAYAMGALINEALNACAFTVLYKPFELDKLLDLIEKAKYMHEVVKRLRDDHVCSAK